MRAHGVKILFAGLLLSAAGAALLAQAPPPMPHADEKSAPPCISVKSDAPLLPLKQVFIDATGTGTFVHEGAVTPGSELYLPFQAGDYPTALRTIKMGDAQDKSLAGLVISKPDPIFWLTRGSGVAVAPHSQPLGEVLDELRGQPVEVSTDGGKTTQKGSIVGVDVGGSDKGKTYTLNFSTDAGIVVVALAPVVSVKLTDDRAGKELQDALNELARGTILQDRPIRLRYDGAAQTPVRITYSHPLPPPQIRYRVDVKSGAKPSASASVTLRNTTAMKWDKVTVGLIDAHWPNEPSGDAAGKPTFPHLFKTISGVTLDPYDYATFNLGETPIEIPSLKYPIGPIAAGQPPTPVTQTLTTSPSEAFPVAGSVTVVEDGVELGQGDLAFGADGSGAVKFSYPLVTVGAGAPVEYYSPVSLANGLLLADVVRTVDLTASNAAKVDKSLTIDAEKGWAIGAVSRCESKISGGKAVVTLASGVTPLTVQETGARRQISLYGLPADDLNKIVQHLKDTAAPGKPNPPFEDVLQLILSKRKSADTKRATNDQERQSLADAINAIAQRQSPGPSGVAAATAAQMLQDEETVAALRLRMDVLSAAKARELYEVDEFIRLQTLTPSDANTDDRASPSSKP